MAIGNVLVKVIWGLILLLKERGKMMTQEQVAGLLLMIISLALLLYPQQIWKFAEKWKSSEHTTSSKAYTIVTRCIGIFFLIIGFAVILY